MELKKRQSRGYAGDRLDDIELGFAYALSHVLNDKTYKDCMVVFEYDRIDKEDCIICDNKDNTPSRNSWLRAREQYLKLQLEEQNRKTGKKVDVQKFIDGTSSKEDEEKLKKSIKRNMQRAREKVRKYIARNEYCLEVENTDNILELLKLILDTYPDPRFFALRKKDVTEWTPELLRKIFGKKKDEEYFLVRTPGDGIIQVGSILCSKKECEIAINEYISDASWKNMKTKLNQKVKAKTKVYDINIAAESIATTKKDKPQSRLCEWGEYAVSVGRRNVKENKPIVLNKVAPRYRMNKVQLEDAEMYEFDSAHKYINYPFTLFNEFHYSLNKHMAFQKCLDFFDKYDSIFWDRLVSELDSKGWTGKSNALTDELVLYHNDILKKEVTYLFVLKPTVRNAKIVKLLTCK